MRWKLYHGVLRLKGKTPRYVQEVLVYFRDFSSLQEKFLCNCTGLESMLAD